MKKIVALMMFAALLAFGACKIGGKDAIDKDGLQGRYEVDMSALSDQLESALKNENIPGALLKMMLSQLDLTVQFESEKAILDASKTAATAIKTLSKNEYSLPLAIDYKIENDSVLYLKREGKGFEEVGVIKKIGDTYDYLKFITKKGDKRTEVDLKKIK